MNLKTAAGQDLGNRALFSKNEVICDDCKVPVRCIVSLSEARNWVRLVSSDIGICTK
jgi:hypothetical protein